MAKGDYKFDDSKAAFAEAERRIREAHDSNATTLDLCELGLTARPQSIENLEQLPILNISINRLTDLPGSLGQLIQLRQFDVCNNRLAGTIQ
jgi:Leucine-rich repeat (LRR) protein